MHLKLEKIYAPTRTKEVNAIKSKVCIPSQGKDLNSEVDSQFGRARYFLIVDLETMEYKAIENPYIKESQGAGIQVAQFLLNKGVDTLLTKNIGPNASKVLESGGIKVITGVSGKIKDVIKEYKERQK